MDNSERKQRLQADILSRLRMCGVTNTLRNVKKWNDSVNRIDFQLPAVLNLRCPANPRAPLIEDEIAQKVDELSLPESEANKIARSVIEDLETVFHTNDIRVGGKRVTNEWDVYGSFKNGLCCKDSDIDFHNGSFENISNADAVSLVEKVWPVFKNDKNFHQDHLIANARVPIVVLKHVRTGKECSISFSGKMGVYNSLLTQLYLGLNSNLKVLTLFLKHVLVCHDLHGTGKITTHMIFWLLVFFMQQKKLLPLIKDVRAVAFPKIYVRNWNYSVPDRYPEDFTYAEPLVSLYSGFLEFYKNFDFLKYVISPYLGYALPIENFETLDIPNEAYIGPKHPNVNGDGLHSFTRSSMNVQDPSIFTVNLTASVETGVANEFRILCEHLFRNCKEAVDGRSPFKISSKSEVESMKHVYKNINQTASIELDFKSLEARTSNLKEYLIAAVSNLMENVLEFDCDKIVSQDVTEVNHKQGDPFEMKIPVVYIDFNTTYRTLRNKYVLSIFEESSSSLRENFRIFFMFEIRRDLERVRVLVEGNSRFVEFMGNFGNELLE